MAVVIATGEYHSVREFATLAFRRAGIELRWEGTGLEEKGIDTATGRTIVDAAFALVVEEYAVGGVHAIAFAVVAHYPEGVLLGHCIWRAGYADLCDSSSLISVINTVRPDEIYNLAAQSHVKVSFEVPEYTADVDALGVLRLLEAVYSDVCCSPLLELELQQTFEAVDNRLWFKNGGEASNVLYVYGTGRNAGRRCRNRRNGCHIQAAPP